MEYGKDNLKKVVFTGGHAGATAYATILKIKEKDKKWKLFWIGSAEAFEGKRVKTLESQMLPSLGVTFYSLFTGRIQRRFTIWTIPSLLKIPLGFLHALQLILKIKPNVVLSFGGYAAFPVVFNAWILGIPVIIHEQTAAAGRANRFSSIFAKKIALSRKSSLKYFDPRKCVILGNPVSPGILEIKPKTAIGHLPTLFITGGSRGSATLNNLVDVILERVLEKYNLIHQTGEFQVEKFVKRRSELGANQKVKYQVYGVIPPTEWPEIIKESDLIVSRAGANVVSEIIASKRPAILIPLPFAYMDEQKRNAEYAEEYGIARMLEEKNLTPDTLLSAIEELRSNWKEVLNGVKEKESPDIKASDNLVSLIDEVIK